VTDWGTIAEVGTAAGTLVLAGATYSAVRSSNRSARIAERSLMLGLRPVLIGSRYDDPTEKVRWGDGHTVAIHGGAATLEVEDGIVYMAIGLRNVGEGLAVLQGWHVQLGRPNAEDPHPDVEEFRRQRRDLYIPASGTGFWQAALRDPADEQTRQIAAAVTAHDELSIHLLYGDHEGGQLTISLFGLRPSRDDAWVAEIGRHWTLDTPDPRLRPE
jgi:hypothetical protein